MNKIEWYLESKVGLIRDIKAKWFVSKCSLKDFK